MRVDIEIYFLGSNEIVYANVDSVLGWTYSGNYFLVHHDEVGGDEKTTRPYYLGDISRIVIRKAETIH